MIKALKIVKIAPKLGLDILVPNPKCIPLMVIEENFDIPYIFKDLFQ